MPGVRIFGCYDPRHDRDLLARLVRDSRSPDSPFEVVAWSGEHDRTADWEGDLRSALDGVDEVVVICGEHADTSVEMCAELRVVQERVKPYFLLYGRRGVTCTKPISARTADTFFSWIWEILKAQIGVTARAPRPSAARTA